MQEQHFKPLPTEDGRGQSSAVVVEMESPVSPKSEDFKHQSQDWRENQEINPKAPVNFNGWTMAGTFFGLGSEGPYMVFNGDNIGSEPTKNGIKFANDVVFHKGFLESASTQWWLGRIIAGGAFVTDVTSIAWSRGAVASYRNAYGKPATSFRGKCVAAYHEECEQQLRAAELKEGKELSRPARYPDPTNWEGFKAWAKQNSKTLKTFTGISTVINTFISASTDAVPMCKMLDPYLNDGWQKNLNSLFWTLVFSVGGGIYITILSWDDTKDGMESAEKRTFAKWKEMSERDPSRAFHCILSCALIVVNRMILFVGAGDQFHEFVLHNAEVSQYPIGKYIFQGLGGLTAWFPAARTRMDPVISWMDLENKNYDPITERYLATLRPEFRVRVQGEIADRKTHNGAVVQPVDQHILDMWIQDFSDAELKARIKTKLVKDARGSWTNWRDVADWLLPEGIAMGLLATNRGFFFKELFSFLPDIPDVGNTSWFVGAAFFYFFIEAQSRIINENRGIWMEKAKQLKILVTASENLEARYFTQLSSFDILFNLSVALKETSMDVSDTTLYQNLFDHRLMKGAEWSSLEHLKHSSLDASDIRALREILDVVGADGLLAILEESQNVREQVNKRKGLCGTSVGFNEYRLYDSAARSTKLDKLDLTPGRILALRRVEVNMEKMPEIGGFGYFMYRAVAELCNAMKQGGAVLSNAVFLSALGTTVKIPPDVSVRLALHFGVESAIPNFKYLGGKSEKNMRVLVRKEFPWFYAKLKEAWIKRCCASQCCKSSYEPLSPTGSAGLRRLNMNAEAGRVVVVSPVVASASVPASPEAGGMRSPSPSQEQATLLPRAAARSSGV